MVNSLFTFAELSKHIFSVQSKVITHTSSHKLTKLVYSHCQITGFTSWSHRIESHRFLANRPSPVNRLLATTTLWNRIRRQRASRACTDDQARHSAKVRRRLPTDRHPSQSTDALRCVTSRRFSSRAHRAIENTGLENTGTAWSTTFHRRRQTATNLLFN